MKILKTIRFDASDERVFELAAASGEWAVSGGLLFAQLEPQNLTGKTRQAFANGFLGTASFGRSTFAVVAEASPGNRADIESALADHFVAVYGAPDRTAALTAARDEIAFVEDLCREIPVHTVFTVRRLFVDGEIKEEFRTIRPSTDGLQHARIWTVTDDDA